MDRASSRADRPELALFFFADAVFLLKECHEIDMMMSGSSYIYQSSLRYSIVEMTNLRK